MNSFTKHTLESAPQEAVPLLEEAQKGYGFIPNLYLMLAESPATLKAYLTLSGLLGESSFSAREQQLILMSISIENGCQYCVAAHSSAAKMYKLPDETTAALRDGDTVDDDRLQALREFAVAVVRERGWVKDRLDAFFAAGFSHRQALEVILAASMKTISNYANHIMDTPLDDALSAMAWNGPATGPVP